MLQAVKPMHAGARARRGLSRSAWLLVTLAAAACGGSGSNVPQPPTADSLTPAQRACRDDLGLGADDCAAVAQLVLPDALPAARGNKYAEDPDALDLGFRIFYDSRFSSVNDMRCATCHLPEVGFDDGKAVSMGRVAVTRNSPTILTAAWMQSYFWDGRADSLWSQPLFAFEKPEEMDFSRLELAHTLYVSPFRDKFEKVFGPMPDLTDTTRFPAKGRPGDAAFDGMAIADQDAINRVAANIGKTLEAYMRKVATGRAPLDRYLLGDKTAMSDAEKKGLSAFARAKCISCHSGPTLSDGKFYDMHVPPAPGAAPDTGRADGLKILAANVFNADGPYFDRDGASLAPTPIAQPTAADVGAFRTPTLREISKTAPYAHNGTFATLDGFLAKHGDVALDADTMNSIVLFLLSLNGAYPQRPWSDWPAR